MKPNRAFVMLASGLLVVDERRLADAYKLATQFHALDSIEVRGGGEAAPGDGDGASIPFRQWVEQQRAHGVTSVAVTVQDGSTTVAGDAGDAGGASWTMGFGEGLPILMRVDTRLHGAVCVQGTVPGPRLSLSASQFAELLNAQSDPDFFWACVWADINTQRQSEGRDAIGPWSLQAYFSSSEGEREWEELGEQMFRDMQADALTHDKPFVIPDGFSGYVEQVTPDGAELEPMTLLEAYDEDAVTAPALLRLIDAQDFGDTIWRVAASPSLLREKLGDSDELDDFPAIAAADWPLVLAGWPDEELARVSWVLIELVRVECETRGVQPRIPDDLAAIFGPNDIERRWYYFHDRLQHDLGWAIREIDPAWSLSVLDRGEDSASLASPRRMVQARQQFVAALTSARDVARRLDAPGQHLLGAARDLAVQAGRTGPVDIAALAPLGLVRQAHWWQLALLLKATFAPFDWGADRLLGLAAVSTADGLWEADAWTDRQFEGRDKAQFQALSLKLFSTLNRYFEALVSFEAAPVDANAHLAGVRRAKGRRSGRRA